MKILTLNIRGLNNKLKRTSVFRKLIKYDICCLQEAYITLKTVELWKSEWDGDFFYHPGTSNSGGLIILIKKSFSGVDITKIEVNERVLGISFILNHKKFMLYNVYAPATRDQRVDFLEQLPNVINPIQNGELVLFCGDFNNLVDNDLDNISGGDHRDIEVIPFNNFINNLDLIDSWRSLHPLEKEYSWIRMIRGNNQANPNILASCTARRLDYIFVNQLLKPFLCNTEMVHFAATDHKAVIATFIVDDFPRGRNFWKFPEQLLDDGTFVNHMSIFITKHLRELSEDVTLGQGNIWDLLKIGIRDECLAFSRNKYINSWDNDNLDEQINDLSLDLSAQPDNPDIMNKLALLCRKKEILELSISNGALKRAKVRQVFEGEKNSPFFLGIEQSRQSNQIIRELYDKESNIVNSPGKILSELSSFYKVLMNEDLINQGQVVDQEEVLNSFLEDTECPSISENDKIKLDCPISLTELDKALKSLNFDSSPGGDGLSPIFYSTFWNLLRTPLFKSYNESIENKSLTLSQRRAILTLLPKTTDLDSSRNVANYRPISLTNTDYKIYSKVLAMRMQTVLEQIIHKNQVGYVEGRSINDHIRLIDDIINTANNEHLKGMLISLDYKKAFDTLSKSSIITALKKFNFGPMFIQFVSTIINGAEASVKNAGWHSEWFATTRGVRQGCGLSPLLFILVVELLSIKLRNKDNIKGILNETEHFPIDDTKLISYADDLTLFIKSIECLRLCIKEIDSFSIFSGLVLNKNKSIGIWLGRDKDNPPGGEGLRWLKKDENVKILGVYFNPCTEASLISINWETKIKSIKTTISHWMKRNISIWGKCIVSKTFLLSQINYIIQSLALPDHVLDQIDDIIFHFVWTTGSNKRGRERLKRDTLCLDISEGGLSMISIKDQQHAFLMKSLHKTNKDHSTTQFMIVDNLLKPVGGLEYFLLCHTKLHAFEGLDTIKSHYWKRAMLSWLTFRTAYVNNDNINCPIPLFNNDNIMFKKLPLFISYWIKRGVKYVHNFLINNRLKSFEELSGEIGPRGSLILEYLAVKTALLNSGINVNVHVILNNPINFSCAFLKLSNKSIRNIVLKQRMDTLKCISTWENKLNVDVSNFFSIGIKSTKESRLRLLHFKIVHYIYPTNIILKKMKIKETNKCDNCAEIETLDHLFFRCFKLKDFWTFISEKVSITLESHFSLNVINALFGITPDDTEADRTKIDKANHIILIAKMCISKAKFSTGKSLRYIYEFESCLRQKQPDELPP